MNRSKAFSISALMLMALTALTTACSSDNTAAVDDSNGTDTEPPSPTTGSIIVAATVDGVNYLVAADNLDEGVISVKGQGKETETGTYWIFKDNKYLFRLVYNKGGNGTGASYLLKGSNTIADGLTYNFNRVTTYGSWGDNVITASAGNTTVKDDAGNIAKGLLVNYLSATDGTVKNFAMNDKCAAGTGRFFEAMARSFELSLPEFSKLSLTAKNVIPITAQCTVFAESEVITLVGEGKPTDEIAAGIEMAVAKRCFVMAKKAGATDSITLTGGCAKNDGLKEAIEHVLKLKVVNLKTDPQLMGALGAAEYARQKGLAKK